MLGSRLSKSPFSSFSRRHYSDKFQAGDYVIITPLKKTVTKKQWLSRPLKELPNANININFGKIPHSDLIGASPLAKVHTIETRKKLAKYTCSRPTLEQWITLSARKAQPIYSFDAQAIVSLTDLHIDYPEPPTEEGGKITPLQFLEAGTGHGSLSLAISKALHPANALAHYANDPNLRGAILHTIDCNGSHSITGKRTLKGFRRGMYLDNVEFHVSKSPSKWVQSDEAKEWSEREKMSKKVENLDYDSDQPDAFLSGVFLDMPNYHEEIVKLAPFVKTDGFIIVFCPSVTQIIDAIDAIADENERLSKLDPPTSLHLEHERTVQLLDGAGGGLKEWDTRRAFIRATGKIGYSVRPKVGVRTVAGGFVAIWRKMGKDVNLEFERDLIENFEGKPDPSEDLDKSIEEEISEISSEDINISHEPKTAEHEPSAQVKDTVESTAINPKAAMFVSDLLTTDPEVFDDATKKIEKISGSESMPMEHDDPSHDILESDTEVNSDFRVEEASLIPRSVLHTVHHSCHGDPDVHVGYITNVFMIESPAPEEFEETSETQKTTTSPVEPEFDESAKEESINHEKTEHTKWTPKTWTKHSF